jgi:hypothetical protein
MPFHPNPWALGALLCIGACLPASAQTVYKCGSRNSVTYSERPCSRWIVNTDPAGVPVKPNPNEVDVRRMEQNRVMSRAMRPRPGESTEQFEKRRRRALLMATDRAECARLDTRMPVEEASMINPDRAEVQRAEMALAKSKKRFSDLRC